MIHPETRRLSVAETLFVNEIAFLQQVDKMTGHSPLLHLWDMVSSSQEGKRFCHPLIILTQPNEDFFRVTEYSVHSGNLVSLLRFVPLIDTGGTNSK